MYDKAASACSGRTMPDLVDRLVLGLQQLAALVQRLLLPEEAYAGRRVEEVVVGLGLLVAGAEDGAGLGIPCINLPRSRAR